MFLLLYLVIDYKIIIDLHGLLILIQDMIIEFCSIQTNTRNDHYKLVLNHKINLVQFLYYIIKPFYKELVRLSKEALIILLIKNLRRR
jgi:hypothetical protein